MAHYQTAAHEYILELVVCGLKESFDGCSYPMKLSTTSCAPAYYSAIVEHTAVVTVNSIQDVL